MGESVAFPYLACLILRTASGCDIVAVKFPGACPGFPDFKTSLTKFFLEFGKVKTLHLLQYAVHGFLDFRFVDFANVLRLYKVPFLGYGIGGFRCLFPIQLSRYSSPERETRFASMCRWACSFLLSVPLCRMMMYWWFANPMRCMKSLPSSAQSASVKVALSSIEGLTSKRRQLFLRSENQCDTVSFPAPFPHQYTHKVHAGLSRWLLPARLSLWRGRTPMPPHHVICFSLSLSS